MPSAISTALKLAPAAMRLAGALHRASAAASGAKSKPKLNINLRVQPPPAQRGSSKRSSAPQGAATLKTLGKIAKPLSRAASHVSAMGRQPSLGSLLKHGLKAAKELQGAARELSKFTPGNVRRAEGGGRTTAAQPKGVKLMVGRPQKNWEHATAENGFHEVRGGQVGGDGKGLRVMVGKPQKNWEQATPEHGYRELKAGGGEKGGEGGKRLRLMVGPVHKNWEHATAENGFTEWKGKSSEGGEGGPRLRIMVGKPRLNWEDALGHSAPREGGRPRSNAVLGRPEPEQPAGLQIDLQFGGGAASGAKKGKASLSDLLKVARQAHALGKALGKSHG
ncbi:MAG: hypothetical protein H3C26_09175 [Rhodocyclaceae bacterium]|nr:hypothetical protein [Rhodocyclaceae bacterium]